MSEFALDGGFGDGDSAQSYSVNLSIADALSTAESLFVRSSEGLSASLTDSLTFGEVVSISANGQSTVQLSDALDFSETILVSPEIAVGNVSLADSLEFADALLARGQADSRQVFSLQGVL